jgi:putative transposase
MLTILLHTMRDILRPRGDLLLENLALRQQINVLRRGNPRPAFRLRNRRFWIVLMRSWAGWRRPLALMQPETVIGWHRKAWRMWWRHKSTPNKPGRPLYVLVVLSLDRRRIVHMNVTTHPTAEWTALQLR